MEIVGLFSADVTNHRKFLICLEDARKQRCKHCLGNNSAGKKLANASGLVDHRAGGRLRIDQFSYDE
jgi:hypothetical protein